MGLKLFIYGNQLPSLEPETTHLSFCVTVSSVIGAESMLAIPVVMCTTLISGSGSGGMFMSGDQVEKVWNYHFQVPGEYKIVFDTWIGSSPSDGDDFLDDNQVSAARETMFTVVETMCCSLQKPEV